jgi:hypothetical protein
MTRSGFNCSLRAGFSPYVLSVNLQDIVAAWQRRVLHSSHIRLIRPKRSTGLSAVTRTIAGLSGLKTLSTGSAAGWHETC